MTVSSTTSRDDYVGTGTAGPFVYGFRIFAYTDLLVTKRNPSSGLETVLSYPADFSGTGAGTTNGGTITLTQVLIAGWALAIQRVRPLTQTYDFRNQGSAFFPRAAEDAFDDAVYKLQQLQDAIGRSVRLKTSIAPSSVNPELPVPSAGKALVWNAAATGLDNGDLSSAQLSAWNAAQNVKVDAFANPGAVSSLALSAAPGNVNNVRVTLRVGGVDKLLMRDEYSVAGTVITFTAPLPNPTRVEVEYLLTFQVNTADAANVTWNASGVGASGRTVLSKLRDVVSVRDYGATGDGVTDDTAAIQNAVNSLSAGDSLVFPRGTYLTGQITLSAAVTLRAQEDGTATLKLKVLAAGNGSAIVKSALGGCRFIGLAFDGNRSNQPADGFSDSFNTGAGGTGRAYRAAICVFPAVGTINGLDVIRCSFAACYGACVATQDVHQVRLLDNIADSNNFEMGFLYSSAGTYLTDHIISRNRVLNVDSGSAGVAGNGFTVSFAEAFVISDNVIHTIQRNGIKLESGKRGVIGNNTIHTNTLDSYEGIQMQTYAESVAVVGNQIYNCSKGITLNGGGTQCLNVAILSNLIMTTIAAGVADGFAMGSGSISGLAIIGNHFADIKRVGILVQPSAACNDITIQGNHVAVQLIAGSVALDLSAGGGNWTGVKISDNVFDHGTVAAPNGVCLLNHAAAETMSEVVFSNNQIRCASGSTGFQELASIVTRGIFSGNLSAGEVYLVGDWDVPDDNVVFNTGILSTVAGVYTGAATPITVKANYRAIWSKLTVPGPVVVNLPANPRWFREYIIKDATGDAAANNVTVIPTGGLIIADTGGNYVINTNYGRVRLLFDGSFWRITGT